MSRDAKRIPAAKPPLGGATTSEAKKMSPRGVEPLPAAWKAAILPLNYRPFRCELCLTTSHNRTFPVTVAVYEPQARPVWQLTNIRVAPPGIAAAEGQKPISKLKFGA
jgi:hypothetical protein